MNFNLNSPPFYNLICLFFLFHRWKLFAKLSPEKAETKTCNTIAEKLRLSSQPFYNLICLFFLFHRWKLFAKLSLEKAGTKAETKAETHPLPINF